MRISYNPFYFEKDGKPWFPVTGEMHYSRTERRYWKRSLYMMKAAGIEIVTSYVFWIHHEEIPGHFDFTGNRDIRAFVETVKEVGMKMILRIGPWVHGEARNGGFPDWLFDKAERDGFELRRSNEKYLTEVERYYKTIYEQVKGLLIEDGGPIIGMQVENEYNSICGGISGPEGDEHIRILTNMLHKIGFNFPIETATAWGDAGVGDLLKVWGGYVGCPWLPTVEELPPSENYVFSYARNDVNIGATEHNKNEIIYDESEDLEYGMPYATAELGGGCQITDLRRPIISGKDTAAMVFTQIASGANLLGFYMYHGGTNPRGKITTLEETPNRIGVSGCLSTLPKFGYDFQAPIGEYCNLHDCYYELRLLLLMINDFGDMLCPMHTHLPKTLPESAADTETLRTAMRDNGEQGFLFVNNYQRRISMNSHKGVSLTAELGGKTITFPTVDIDDGDFFVWPINMPIGDGVLKCASASPLFKLKDNTYIFYGHQNPTFEFEKAPTNARTLWLSRNDALKAQKVNICGKDYCIVSDATVLSTDNGVKIYSTEKPVLKVYPHFETTPVGYTRLCDEGEFAVYEKNEYADFNVNSEFKLISDKINSKVFRASLEYSGEMPEDVFLNINFEGNYITVFVDGQIVTDNYYNSEPFVIGLSRYSFPKEIDIEIDVLRADKQVYLQYDPRNGKDVCSLLGIDYKTMRLSKLEF